jgi:aspartyl-tRNA(Asn)/glutamyl-tRNA(Gln) amidotransferase subunit A
LNPFFDLLSVTVKNKFKQLLDKLTNKGFVITFVNFPDSLVKTSLGIYIAISTSEAYSSHCNLTGLTFGNRSNEKNYLDTITRTRQVNFGYQAKKRYILGSFSLLRDNQRTVLLKAKQLRQLIAQHLTDILTQHSFILGITNPYGVPKINQLTKQEDLFFHTGHHNYDNLNYLLFANFAGMPSINIPFDRFKKMPLGLTIDGAPFSDQLVLNMAFTIESLLKREKIKDEN